MSARSRKTPKNPKTLMISNRWTTAHTKAPTLICAVIRVWAVLLLASVVASCSVLDPRPDLTRNYLLTPAEPSGASVGAGPAIGVGPIRLPPYLDRAAIVSRTELNSIRYSERHRWAEPLQENFGRVLAADLADSVGTNEVLMFPWYGNPELDYRVLVDVERFDHSPGGTAVLVARWKLQRGSDGEILSAARSSLEHPVAKRSTKVAVEALSRVTADLAAEIAAAIASNP